MRALLKAWAITAKMTVMILSTDIALNLYMLYVSVASGLFTFPQFVAVQRSEIKQNVTVPWSSYLKFQLQHVNEDGRIEQWQRNFSTLIQDGCHLFLSKYRNRGPYRASYVIGINRQPHTLNPNKKIVLIQQ